MYNIIINSVSIMKEYTKYHLSFKNVWIKHWKARRKNIFLMINVRSENDTEINDLGDRR